MKREIRDGLILRSLSEGHASDREGLPGFYVRVFGEADLDESQYLDGWTQDLMDGHPTTTPDDIWVVVDPAQDDRIVSALLLIPQTWRYEDVTLGVGRVEIVATDREYRRKGLVRELFVTAHERSVALGHTIQAITGIPYFYRQFGYAMAVELGMRTVVPLDAVNDLKDDQKPAYTLRPATPDDVPAIQASNAFIARHSLLSTERTKDLWRYELDGKRAGSAQKFNWMMIVDTAGEAVGYLAVGANNDEKRLACLAYAVGDQASYLATFDDVIRGLKQYAREKHPDNPPQIVLFDSGAPQALDILADHAFPGQARQRIYAWYLRAPNLVRLIRELAPVLERRLEGSGAHRFTGELSIGTYGDEALVVRFENGCIAEVEMAERESTDCAFPEHTLLNVIFGHRTAEELACFRPDAWANRKAAVLLDALFPKKRSWLFPVQ